MHKSNKVVILSNDANVVVLVLYYVEEFEGEGYKNFGLDMVKKIIPDTSQFILCMSNGVRISFKRTYFNRTWYDN